MKRWAPWLAAVGILTAVLVIGLSQAGGGGNEDAPAQERFDLAEAKRELAGAPAPLAALHAQSGELLGGGREAFEARLAELEGRPLVINKWASWCGPCVAEFPHFQQLATERGKEVAFLGLNSFDATGDARRFLEQYPVPYPSYEDQDEDIAESIDAAKNFPITVFVDRRGGTFVKQGVYESAADLEADIDRYALAG